MAVTDIRLRLRVASSDSWRPRTTLGSAVAVECFVTDQNGAPVPGAVVDLSVVGLLVIPGMVADAAGRVTASFTPQQAGAYAAQADCTAPLAETAQRIFDVLATDGDPQLSPPWVDAGTGALIFPPGDPVTAQRIDALPLAGALQPSDTLPCVRAGAGVRVTGSGILEAAADAGAAAGAEAGRVAGATAGAAAGTTAGSASGATAGAAAGSAAGSTAGATAGAAAGATAGAAAAATPAIAYDRLRAAVAGYVVWLIWGQSNSVGRGTFDALFDVTDPAVWQFDCNAASATYRQIVAGADPLRTTQRVNTGQISPASLMARHLAMGIPARNRVLLVHCGVDGTSSARWGVGGDLYLNAIDQANRAIVAAQAEFPASVFGGIFGLQGEADQANTQAAYEAFLVAQAAGFRSSITGATNAPYVLGGMTPEHIGQDTQRFIQRAHVRAPVLIERAAFTHGPAGVTVNSVNDYIHFNAVGNRETGRRAARAYQRAAVNIIGQGVPLAPVVASVAVQGASAALVELTPPLCRWTSFDFQWSANGGSTWNDAAYFETSADYRRLVTGITSGAAAVVFRARAVNEAGTGAWGAASSAVAMTTAAVPGQAFGVRASGIGNTTATLDWYPPETGDTLTSYTAAWRIAAIGNFPASGWNNTSIAAGTLTAALSGLPAGTALEFSVVANNATGSGARSVVAAGNTTGTGVAPGALSSVTAGAVGQGSLSFTVGLPTTGGATTKLVSRYRVTGSGSWTTGPESTSVVLGISGLLPNTSYDVEIAAANLAGTGPYTATTGTTTAVEYLIDAQSITARGAYSLRKLRTSYAGKCIRVRRSSDDTEQDIDFTIYGLIDTAALLTFVGSGSGFVVTWYDQSGNGRNVTQATTASQPRIVNAGVLEVTQANQPAVKFGQAGTVTPLSQSTDGVIPTSAAFFTSICMRQPATGTSNGGTMVGQADGGLMAIGLGLSSASESTAVRWIVFGSDATSGRTSTGGGTLTNGAAHSIATNFTNSGPRAGDIWEDGTKVNAGVTFAGTTQTATLISLGALGTPGSTGVYTGFLTEVIIGAGALSDAQIAAIRTSHQGAWGAA